jgi:hypothetical protein
MKSFTVESLVFIDESGVQRNTTRPYGRITEGLRKERIRLSNKAVDANPYENMRDMNPHEYKIT